jgi:hypothetical protein
MIRARFYVATEDPLPVNWPIKHPYWITGYTDNAAILVAYADDEAEILQNWPDAKYIVSREADEYAFTSRFPKPEWFTTTTETP